MKDTPITLEKDEEFESVRNLKEYDHIRLNGKPYQFLVYYGHGNGWIISHNVVVMDEFGKQTTLSLREFNKLLEFNKV